MNQPDEITNEMPEKAEEKERGKRGGLLRILKILFLVLVAVFLFRYFYKNYDDIKALDLKLSPGPFAVSILFYFAYKLSIASLWHYITCINHCSIPWAEAVRAYMYSVLGKYIPGKVFMLFARIPPYREKGIPAEKVTVCFLLENACTLLSASLVFVVSILFFPEEVLGNYKWGAIALIVLFFVCIHPAILNFFLGLLERVTKRKGMRIPMTYPQIIRVVLLFVCNWFIYGFGFYMLICSIHPIPLSQYVFVTGVYALSCMAGIMAIISPSGLGVREGILVLGLRLLMDTNLAMVISLVARLWAVLTELVLIAIVLLIYAVANRKNKDLAKAPEGEAPEKE